jgi:hypothetical protein
MPVPASLVNQLVVIFILASGAARIDDYGPFNVFAPPSTPPPAQTVQNSPTGVQVTQSGTMAPAAVHVAWSGTNNPPATVDQLPRVTWDFGDPGSAHNTATGFNAAHLYLNAGTYTITENITAAGAGPGGNITVQTTSVTIAADTRPAVYVSSSTGSDTNPGTADAPLNTIAMAVSKFNSGSEMFLKAGDTFPLATSVNLSATNQVVQVYGGGGHATVQWSGAANGMIFGTQSTTVNTVVRDIDFTEPSGVSLAPYCFGGCGNNLTLDECTATGSGIGYLSTFSDAKGAAGALIQDCSTNGIGAYSVFLEGSDIAIQGCNFANSTAEHLLRGTGDRVAITGNILANLQGGDVTTSKDAISPQGGSFWTIAENDIGDGGPVTFGPIATAQAWASGNLPTISWCVYEANTCSVPLNIAPGTLHLLARNNTITQNGNNCVNFEAPANGTYPNGQQVTLNAQDIQILFNTLSNTGNNAATGAALKSFSGFGTGAVFYGNTFSAPSLSIGDYFAAEMKILDSDLSGFATIGGNVWSQPAATDYHLGNGALFYVGNTDGVWTSFLTLAQWNAQAKATVPDVVGQANPVPVPAGVFVDDSGTARTATSSPGASQ